MLSNVSGLNTILQITCLCATVHTCFPSCLGALLYENTTLVFDSMLEVFPLYPMTLYCSLT